MEFYAGAQALWHWRYYLIGKDFVIYSDHEALKHLQSQQHERDRRIKWSSYLQAFTFSLRYKAGKENMVADALSRQKHLLTTMAINATCFEQIK